MTKHVCFATTSLFLSSGKRIRDAQHIYIPMGFDLCKENIETNINDVNMASPLNIGMFT